MPWQKNSEIFTENKMWSVTHKTVNRRQGNTTSHCRVCKQKTSKMHVTEEKSVSILWLIPISLNKEYFEICSSCKARVRVFVNLEQIDYD